MIFSIILLFVKPLTAVFFILYFGCGASDVLDGYIARKTNTASQFGATLDSIADTIFTGVLLVILISIVKIPLWVLVWIVGIAGIRIASLLVGFLKYHTFAFLHTYANKATGTILFCFPLLYLALGVEVTATLICGLASCSSLEELALSITSKTLYRNVKSIFIK